MSNESKKPHWLPERWVDLPWKRINWALHAAWAVALLLLLNSCGRKRNFDSLSISLTILEIVIVIALIGGFWIIRPEVKETARSEAREAAIPEARRAAEEFFASLNPASDDGQALADALAEDGEDGAKNG